VLTRIESLNQTAGSRAEEVVRRIESLILHRGTDGGVRLGSKEELRQSFQVAHGTMNEAMRVLETRGLIELRRGPQGGVFVAAPSIQIRLSYVFLGFREGSDAVPECLAVRNQLESLTIIEAAKAAPHKPDEVKELYRLLDNVRDTIGNPEEALQWNWRLHRHIARMGANKVLTGIYIALLDYAEQHLTKVSAVPTCGRAERVLQMHRDIVDAIASGDVEKAAQAAKHHPLPPEDIAPPAQSEPGKPRHNRRRRRV
jgi:DNA-binding FadR family transcriptional regulator